MPFIRRDKEDEFVDLVVKVKEKKRFWAKTGTELGTTGGNLNTSVNIRNVFGGGETVEASAAYGVETEAALNRDTELPLGSTASSSFSVSFDVKKPPSFFGHYAHRLFPRRFSSCS